MDENARVFVDSILGIIKSKRGIDFNDYRRSTLHRRIDARMARLQCLDPEAYLRRLETDPSECDGLIDAIAVNVSSFFRDPIVWEVLAESVLPEVLERKRLAGDKEIRVWSAGCAAGEEPYSIAILIHRALESELDEWRVHVFGTDVDKTCLRAAGAGIFSRESLRDAKLGLVDRYFEPIGHGYRLKPFVREMVQFSHDDLLSSERDAPVDSVFGTFDLVLCRNLLIYFSRDCQQRVLRKLYRSLSTQGYLVLGESEILAADERAFRFVDGTRNLRLFKRI